MVYVGPLARTLAALGLITLLLAGGPLLGRAWDYGAHGSPDQWNYHLLLNSLGFVDHHAANMTERPPPADELSALAVTGPGFAPVAPPAVIVLETMALLGLVGAVALGAGLAAQRLVPAGSCWPTGRAVGPAEHPPRVHAELASTCS